MKYPPILSVESTISTQFYLFNMFVSELTCAETHLKLDRYVPP